MVASASPTTSERRMSLGGTVDSCTSESHRALKPSCVIFLVLVSSQEKILYNAGTDPRRKTVVGNVRRNGKSTSMFAETLTFGHAFSMVLQIFL